jgi:hypothetical protein
VTPGAEPDGARGNQRRGGVFFSGPVRNRIVGFAGAGGPRAVHSAAGDTTGHHRIVGAESRRMAEKSWAIGDSKWRVPCCVSRRVACPFRGCCAVRPRSLSNTAVEVPASDELVAEALRPGAAFKVSRAVTTPRPTWVCAVLKRLHWARVCRVCIVLFFLIGHGPLIPASPNASAALAIGIWPSARGKGRGAGTASPAQRAFGPPPPRGRNRAGRGGASDMRIGLTGRVQAPFSAVPLVTASPHPLLVGMSLALLGRPVRRPYDSRKPRGAIHEIGCKNAPSDRFMRFVLVAVLFAPGPRMMPDNIRGG